MSVDEQSQGVGETLVGLLGCVERSTDRVEHVLPSVDHHLVLGCGPDPGSVLSTLRATGLDDLVGLFEAWMQRLNDFDTAIARLTGLRDGVAGNGSDYQVRLGECIREARHCRQAVEEASEGIRRRVAKKIDVAFTREEEGRSLAG